MSDPTSTETELLKEFEEKFGEYIEGMNPFCQVWLRSAFQRIASEAREEGIEKYKSYIKLRTEGEDSSIYQDGIEEGKAARDAELLAALPKNRVAGGLENMIMGEDVLRNEKVKKASAELQLERDGYNMCLKEIRTLITSKPPQQEGGKGCCILCRCPDDCDQPGKHCLIIENGSPACPCHTAHSNGD